MVGRNVEQLEIHDIRFHLSRAKDLKAHLAKNLEHFAQRLRRGMNAPALWAASGQGHV